MSRPPLTVVGKNEPAQPQKRTVLVVDDDPIQTGQIAMFLQSQGIEVVTENNGYAAVNAIKRIKPAIVIMDVRMPGLDGIEAARLIAGLVPRPRVILMSGYPDSVFAANRQHAEVFAVIEKPIPLSALLQFVRRALT